MSGSPFTINPGMQGACVGTQPVTTGQLPGINNPGVQELPQPGDVGPTVADEAQTSEFDDAPAQVGPPPTRAHRTPWFTHTAAALAFSVTLGIGVPAVASPFMDTGDPQVDGMSLFLNQTREADMPHDLLAFGLSIGGSEDSEVLFSGSLMASTAQTAAKAPDWLEGWWSKIRGSKAGQFVENKIKAAAGWVRRHPYASLGIGFGSNLLLLLGLALRWRARRRGVIIRREKNVDNKRTRPGAILDNRNELIFVLSVDGLGRRKEAHRTTMLGRWVLKQFKRPKNPLKVIGKYNSWWKFWKRAPHTAEHIKEIIDDAIEMGFLVPVIGRGEKYKLVGTTLEEVQARLRAKNGAKQRRSPAPAQAAKPQRQIPLPGRRAAPAAGRAPAARGASPARNVVVPAGTPKGVDERALAESATVLHKEVARQRPYYAVDDASGSIIIYLADGSEKSYPKAVQDALTGLAEEEDGMSITDLNNWGLVDVSDNVEVERAFRELAALSSPVVQIVSAEDGGGEVKYKFVLPSEAEAPEAGSQPVAQAPESGSAGWSEVLDGSAAASPDTQPDGDDPRGV